MKFFNSILTIEVPMPIVVVSIVFVVVLFVVYNILPDADENCTSKLPSNI